MTGLWHTHIIITDIITPDNPDNPNMKAGA